MRKSTPILLSIAVLLILSLACAVSGVPAPTQDINSLGTAIMGTMMSAATQTAAAGFPVGLVDTSTPTQTFTPELPTVNPTATSSPMPIFTATSVVPQISVSVATNCRVGPGKIYDRVGALQVGQVAEVVGRNAVSNYWYIRNPSESNEFCWLWGEYATVTGNLAALPVYTPPPTPTPMPDFEAAYDGWETCTGWWVEIELSNTGGLAFESMSMTVRDATNEMVVSMYADNFTDVNGCFESSVKEVLNPGAKRTVSAPAFLYDPRGHDLRATLTLCSKDGQNGMCLTESIRFTP
jgi:hypothetical protein